MKENKKIQRRDEKIKQLRAKKINNKIRQLQARRFAYIEGHGPRKNVRCSQQSVNNASALAVVAGASGAKSGVGCDLCLVALHAQPSHVVGRRVCQSRIEKADVVPQNAELTTPKRDREPAHNRTRDVDAARSVKSARTPGHLTHGNLHPAESSYRQEVVQLQPEIDDGARVHP